MWTLDLRSWRVKIGSYKRKVIRRRSGTDDQSVFERAASLPALTVEPAGQRPVDWTNDRVSQVDVCVLELESFSGVGAVPVEFVGGQHPSTFSAPVGIAADSRQPVAALFPQRAIHHHRFSPPASTRTYSDVVRHRLVGCLCLRRNFPGSRLTQ